MIDIVTAEPSVSRGLTADHSRLDILFDDARRLAGAGDFDGARRVFAQLAQGLKHHIAIEERFLFPAFEARANLVGPTTCMRHEHRAIDQLLALADASLAAADGGLFANEAAELAALLHDHNLKEERILYPRSDGALTGAERAQVLAELRRR